MEVNSEQINERSDGASTCEEPINESTEVAVQNEETEPVNEEPISEDETAIEPDECQISDEEMITDDLIPTEEPKLTLSFKSARAFIEHCLKLMRARNVGDRAFLKFLLISDGMLKVARKEPIFCLSAGYFPDGVALSISSVSLFESKKLTDFPDFSNCFAWSYKATNSLLSWLKPSHFLLGIADPELTDEDIRQCTKQLDCVPGKIALVLAKEIKHGFSLLLNYFTIRQLDFLLCSPELLANTAFALSLQVVNYIPGSVVENAQLSVISRHRIQAISIDIDDKFGATPQTKLIKSPYSSLTHLHVSCRSHYDSLMSLLDYVEKQCSVLEMLSVAIVFSRDYSSIGITITDTSEIVGHFLETLEKIEEIVERSRSLVLKLKIDSMLMLDFSSNFEYDCDWVEQVKTMQFFENTNHQDVIDSQFEICQLESEFDDGFLTFAHSTKVFRSLPQQ